MDVEIHTIPAISTAHLTKEVAERLTAEGNKNPWCPCAAWDYGYFLFLDELEASDGEVPQCLLDTRDWLRNLEDRGILGSSRWVRLDRDADTVDGLPTYDW